MQDCKHGIDMGMGLLIHVCEGVQVCEGYQVCEGKQQQGMSNGKV